MLLEGIGLGEQELSLLVRVSGRNQVGCFVEMLCRLQVAQLRQRNVSARAAGVGGTKQSHIGGFLSLPGQLFRLLCGDNFGLLGFTEQLVGLTETAL